MSPNATSVSAAGDTSTALTTWATVTAAVPDAEPAVAVIVALPFAAAVTSPDASTAATGASLLVHATVAPVITRPFWSRTSAVSRTVSPRADSVAEPGLTITVVATGAGGGGSTAPSPQDRTSMATAPTAIAEIAKSAPDRPGPRLRQMCQRRVPARPSSGSPIDCMSVPPTAASGDALNGDYCAGPRFVCMRLRWSEAAGKAGAFGEPLAAVSSRPRTFPDHIGRRRTTGRSPRVDLLADGSSAFKS